MKVTKIIALLLALATIFVCLVACGGGSSETDTTKKETSKDTGSQETEPEIQATLPDKTYDTTLNVLHWTVDESWIPWEEIVVEDMNGDVMNDKVFERNGQLSEQFGITLENEYLHTVEITGKVSNAVKSGDNDYQIIVQRGYQFQFLMTSDNFADISSLPYVDTEKPWWNQDSIQTFTFGSRTMLAASDLLLLDKGSTSAVIYNTSIANDLDYAANYFYNMVKDYEWTLEELCKAAERAYRDVDGDGVNSANDIYGAQGGDDPMHFMLNGAGEHFLVNTGDENLMDFTFGGERVFDVVLDTLDLLLNQDWYISSRTVPVTIENAFMNNQVFFSISRIKDVNKLREMESDYGVLPIPMYEADQQAYHCEISPHHDSLLAIPIPAAANDEEAEAVGVALEALSYISHSTVYPTLYDVVISSKGVRDQESKEMLEIIFNSRMYDLGIIFDFGSFADRVLRMPSKGVHDIASLLKEYEATINTKMDETIGVLNSFINN